MAKSNIQSIIIVESSNDKAFIQTLIKHIKSEDKEKVGVAEEIEVMEMETLESFEGDDGKMYNGLSKKTLEQKLKNIHKEIDQNYPNLQKVGIIIDADDKGIEDRIHLCNEVVSSVFAEINIKNLNEIQDLNFSINESPISLIFSYFCMNVGGFGELTSVLKSIKNVDSPYADCLIECWQPCFIAKGKDISPNQMDKLWMEIFLKYDTTSSRNRNRNSANLALVFAGRDGKGKEIFNLNAEILAPLNAFLHTFR